MPAPKFHSLATLPIPRGMVWVDEFGWSAVDKSLEYSLRGAAIIDSAKRLAGRPITLQGEEEAGWISRDALRAVQSLADSSPDGTYSLLLADGRTFTVQFAPGTPVEGRPIARPELPEGTYPYVATVRLITV